jgi:hypothetical protein
LIGFARVSRVEPFLKATRHAYEEREDNGRVLVKDSQTHHLEGLTVATPWRLESVFPHHNRRQFKAAVLTLSAPLL